MNRIALTLAGLSVCCLALGYSVKGAVDQVRLDKAERWRVVDGDSIVGFDMWGNRTRYRLNGIDAPELPGHCRQGRNCAVGDPDLSRYWLEVGLEQGPVTVERIKKDRYGRWIAQVKAGSVDLSCWQLGHGQAAYMPRWDEGERTARACGGVAAGL